METRRDISQKQRREGGFSILSLLCSLPVICLFLFAIIDLGRTIMLNTSLDSANAAICRHIEIAPDTPNEVLLSLARTAAPSLASEALTVTTTYEPVKEITYDHRFYDLQKDSFIKRPAQVSCRPFKVTLTLTGAFMTPLGIAVAQGQGWGDGSFQFSDTNQGAIDTTIEGGI